jgi:hypothetical protein
MITVEAGLVGVFQALQALLVQVREWELVPIDPVEDAKLHSHIIHLRVGVLINHAGRLHMPMPGRDRESVRARWRLPLQGATTGSAVLAATFWQASGVDESLKTRVMSSQVYSPM